jgi:hypothetical protein
VTTFSDLHRGQRVRLYDVDGEDLLPPVFLLLEAARPCENGCCEAWALPPGKYTPYKLHARATAEVVLVPRQPSPLVSSEFAGPRADAVAEHDTSDKPLPTPRDPRNPAEDEMTDDDNETYHEEQSK